MAGDFFPRRDAELRNFSTNLAHKLLEAPHLYGIGLQRAERYADLDARYADCYWRTVDPSIATR